MKINLLGLLLLVTFLISISCNRKQQADLILFNGVVYTVDSTFSVKQAIAIQNGKILACGSDLEIKEKFEAKETTDLKGNAVYPGFIDAHCHFLYYGIGLNEAELFGLKSFSEVLEKLKSSEAKENAWLLGRGWDQNLWEGKSFPDNHSLDSMFPTIPVFLKRIDGHAALANSEALRRAGLTTDSKTEGGVVEIKNGRLTGILVDNAMDLVEKKIPPPDAARLCAALMNAQKNCFAAGLTTVDDAGLKKSEVLLMDSLQKVGLLKMRVYAMLMPGKENEENFYGKKNGRMKTDRLNVRSVKLYGDGALGSRGACLLQAYADKSSSQGFLLTDADSMKALAKLCKENDFQLNTHCIGDSANRLLLKIYGDELKDKNDLRWRIEHAQVVNEKDVPLFEKYSVIPSVQPTHATSDMYWATERLGPQRIKNAYAYKKLLRAAGTSALGTDFPVEKINPLLTFYAAVVRKDLKGFPAEGFQMDDALSREEALKGMTIMAAFSNFEEHEKGSIEAGKFADLVILDDDLMKVPPASIPTIKVLKTIVHGEVVYRAQ